jgi:hypothetical protein
MTACFHILLNSFFINHPIIQHNRIWATDPFRGTMWVYVTYSLGSVPKLAYRGSEKGSLKLYFRVLCRDTQVGSHSKTVGQQHKDRKDPCWWDGNFIKLIGINTKRSMNLDEKEEDWLLWKTNGRGKFEWGRNCYKDDTVGQLRGQKRW